MIHKEFEDYFEILRDERAEAMGMGIKRGSDHELVHCEWAEYLNRRLGRKDLFAYKHQKTGNYVLAAWVFKDTEIFTELETSEKHFDRGGWKDYRYMELRCRPDYVIRREMQENIAKRQASEKRKQEENIEMREKAVKYQNSRGAYMDPSSPFDYDENSGLVEELKTMSRLSNRKHFT